MTLLANFRRCIIINEVNQMDITSAIKYALDGRALLILGAGFSRNALNLRNSSMPNADGLRALIYSEVCHESMDSIPKEDWENLEDLAERCIEEGHADELCSFLKSCFIQNPSSITSSGDEQTVLHLPWRRIYSTNYDDVAENYSRSSGILRVPVTLSNSIKEHQHDNVIIHLNGYIEALTPSALNSEFKLSSSSYLDDSFASNEWVRMLKSDIDAASAVILIGISGNSDLDIRRLIYNDGQYQDKIIFIDISKRLHDARLKFGSIETIGLHGLSERIQQIESTHIPNTTPFLYSCFEQFKYTNSLHPTAIDSTARRMLLEKGIVDTDILKNHISDNEYLFSRAELSLVINLIQNSPTRCICITSRLANGKSCFLNLLSANLVNLGWNVFVYRHENVHLQEELDSFGNTTFKTVIIVESYHLYFSLLERIRRVLDNKKIVLILSSRTGIHTSVCRRIPSTIDISEENIQEINLDRLSASDISNLINLLDKGDYLLTERSLNHQQKCSLVLRNCNSSISSTLLKYVHSQTVKDRLNESVRLAFHDLIAQKIIISTFVLQMLSIDLNANELFALLNIRGLSQSVINNPGFQDLVDINNGKLVSHSTILAQYIIKLQSPDTILSSMIAMNQNADKLFSSDKQHAVRASFITYSNINLLISPHSRNEVVNRQILEYYYTFSQSKIYDDNPFFWLQYAIASMEIHDYSRASDLFQKAYDCANLRAGFDTFQIDTQYARFILEESCRNGSDTPFNDFSDATAFLDKAVKSSKSNLRLVIKQVVKAYPLFFSKYRSVLSSEQKGKILSSTNEFIKLANQNNITSKKYNRPSEIISNSDLKVLSQLKQDILNSECTTDVFS